MSEMQEEVQVYKLINGDRLAYNIGNKVTLYGILNEDGNITLDTGKGIVEILSYESIGAFPGNSRVAEIRGEVRDTNSITFSEGFALPATADPDMTSMCQAIELATEAGVISA